MGEMSEHFSHHHSWALVSIDIECLTALRVSAVGKSPVRDLLQQFRSQHDNQRPISNCRRTDDNLFAVAEVKGCLNPRAIIAGP
jgi:hypothetical protein